MSRVACYVTIVSNFNCLPNGTALKLARHLRPGDMMPGLDNQENLYTVRAVSLGPENVAIFTVCKQGIMLPLDFPVVVLLADDA